jgi:hypothetical protein
MNGRSQPHYSSYEPNSILLHLVDGQARMETKLDQLHDRITKVEDHQTEPAKPRRPLSEYMPIAYGLGLLIAILTGKLTILQVISALKG